METNTNLKIALLLGYVFHSRGWTTERDPDEAFRPQDKMDYQVFDYDSQILDVMEKLENKFNIQFNFRRIDGIYRMQEIAGRNIPDINQVMDKTLHGLLKQAIELTFNGVDEQISRIKEDNSWAYYQIKALEKKEDELAYY